MIGYQGATRADAGMYWGQSLVFRMCERGVVPYRVGDIEADDPDTEFSECDVMLVEYGRSPSQNRLLHTTGHDLTHSPEFITHRFPLGYITAGGMLLTVTYRAPSASVVKGLSPDRMTHHIVQEIRGVDSPIQYTSTTGPVGVVHAVRGVADVLEVGASPAMRLVYTPDQALVRSREHTLRSMNNRQSIIVPSFDVALLRIKDSEPPKWLVVSDDAVIGHATLDGVVIYLSSSDNEHVRMLQDEARKQTALLIADEQSVSYSETVTYESLAV